MKFVESVLGSEESPWWEMFVKELGFGPEKSEGVMTGESGE